MKRFLQITLLLAGLAWCVPAQAITFTHTRGAGGSGNTVTSFSVAMGATPASGSIVACSLHFSAAISALLVKDANNITYVISPNSPATNGTFKTYDAYLLSASGASATINVTWTTSANGDAQCDEFAVSGGTQAFDTDIAGTGTGTAINTPTIVPAGSGELLFGGAVVANNLTAPTAGSAAGVWTGAAGNFKNGDGAEYVLSSSGSVALNMTQSPSGTWASMIMAFKASAVAAHTMPPAVY